MAEFITFTYDGTSSATLGVSVMDVRRPLLPEQEVTGLTIPGRDGSWYTGKRLGSRTVEVDVAVVGTSFADAQTKTRALASTLALKLTPKALTFSDEPNLAYFAILSGDTDWNRIAEARAGTLKFVCPDPYIYATSDSSNNVAVGSNSIASASNMDAYPRFTLSMASDATYVQLVNETTNQTMLVGTVPPDDGTLNGGWLTEFNDDCGTYPGSWVTGSFTQLGVIAGTMGTSSGHFYPTGYGTDTNNYHGPNIRRTITTARSDFRVTLGFSYQMGATSRTSRLGLLIGDGQGTPQILCAAWIEGYKTGVYAIKANLYTGGVAKTWVSEYLPLPYLLNNGFPNSPTTSQGSLIIERKSNQWKLSVGRILKPLWDRRYRRIYYYQDAAGDYADTMKVVELHGLKFYNLTAPSQLYYENVAVQSYAAPGGTDYPYVIRTGDVLYIDCEAGDIFSDLQGPLLSKMWLGSQFFPLAPGTNTIRIDTNGTLNGSGASKVEWTPRSL